MKSEETAKVSSAKITEIIILNITMKVEYEIQYCYMIEAAHIIHYHISR